MGRWRVQRALEQQRLKHEMELRRAHVAKTRPTWMLAITGIALVAAVGLIFFAVQRKRESDAAAVTAQQGEEDKTNAEAVAKEAQDRVDRLARDMKDQDDRLTAADAAV